VKFDPLLGGTAPTGTDWELAGMGLVGDQAEDYYTTALDVAQRMDGRRTQ